MKILFLGGNLARTLADWLELRGEEVVSREDKISIEEVKGINPDFIISYNYRYIISKEIIDFVNGNAINLHISYLPYNRGSHPNIWSFLEETPKVYHLSDGYTSSEKDIHLNLGKGNFDLAKLISVIPHNSLVTLETPRQILNGLNDFVSDVEYLRTTRIIKTSEQYK